MKKDSLISKFLSFSIGSWISILIAVVTTPITTRLLSPEEFGKFSMFELYTNITMAFIICGIDQAFVRFFYEEKEEDRKNLLFSCLKIPFILNIASILILVLFGKQISNYLFGEYSIRIIILLIVHTTFLILNRFATMLIRMQQKGKTYSALLIAQKVSNLIFILLSAGFFNRDFRTLAYAAFFSNLVVTLVGVVVELNYWNIFTLNKKDYKRSQKEILEYGIPLLFTFVITWLFQSADKIAIKHFNDLNEVGIYGSAFKIISILNIIQSSFTTFWVPVAFERYEKDPNDTKFFEKMNLLITVVMMLGGILLILFRDLIILLLGKEYRSAIFLIPFLSFMPIMYTISETTVMGINFLKNPKSHIYIAAVACIANIIGNILLVPIYGAKGAAISTGISYIIFFAMRTFISLKHFKVNYHIKEFSIMTIALTLYVLYSTFMEVNLTYILIGIGEIGLLLFVYRDYVGEGIKKFKAKLKKN